MTVASNRTVDNSADTSRKWPTTALAEKVLTAREGNVQELLPGTGIGAPIALQYPIYPNTLVYALAFVTATGLTGLKTLLVRGTDFTVVESNAQGVGTITPLASQVGNSLLIVYSPSQAEGTIGGQSSVV